MKNEDIFAFFQTLSGAKRIELMCGLISMCIPLEVRFFETIIHDTVKKDYNSFLDAQLKANSYPELDMVCKCDLLFEKVNNVSDQYYDESNSNTTEMNGNGACTNNTTASNNISMLNNSTSSANTTNANDSQPTSNASNSSSTNKGEPLSVPTTTNATPNANVISSFPSRSKLIISLCLMEPSNSTCSSLVFNSIRKQLTVENIYNAVYNVYIPKNQNINQLFSEILLLLTMAMYHPAFTYEQRDLLATQKKDIERLYVDIFIRSHQLIAAQVPVPIAPVGSPPTTGPAPLSSSATNAVITSNSGQQPTIFHQSAASATTNLPSSGPQQAQPQPNPPQAPQVAQSHHTQPSHQYHHHSYHSSGNKSSHHQNAGPPPAPMGPPQFPLSYMPLANIAYTSTPGPQQVPNMNNQTNAVMQSLAMLKVNSPQPSSSPSPSISPSSVASNNKITIPVVPTSTTSQHLGQYLKYDSIPNPQLIPILDPNNPLCIPAPLVVDDNGAKSSVSSTTSVSSSASCYNCGNMGHRGTECTSVGTASGDDNH